MGWWATDVLGGDAPLDVLANLERVLGLEAEDGSGSALYPLDQLDPAQRDKARVAFEAQPDAFVSYNFLAEQISGGYQPDYWIAVQVMATVVMAVGARMSDHLKALALRAADNDPWLANQPDDFERAESIQAYRQAVSDYVGTPVVLGHQGLFEVIAEAPFRGLVNKGPGEAPGDVVP